MTIQLSKDLRSNSATINPYDVRQVKQTLNQLGYYKPDIKIGMNEIPDRQMFDAIKTFQSDNGLKPTGELKPNDITVQRMNEKSLEEEPKPYVWVTMADAKVRASHTELHGEIRTWDQSPVPGEEQNCRCTAIPVNEPAGLRQILISAIKDAKPTWNSIDFINHFYTGGGEAVSLSQIGLLSDAVDHAEDIIFERVEQQIERLAQAVKDGPLNDMFENSYNFGSVSFSLGNSTIKGKIEGTAKAQDGVIFVYARVEYQFFDEFTDPLSIRQSRTGSSNSKNADANTELGGTAYEIVDRWMTEVRGSVIDPSSQK